MKKVRFIIIGLMINVMSQTSSSSISSDQMQKLYQFFTKNHQRIKENLEKLDPEMRLEGSHPVLVFKGCQLVEEKDLLTPENFFQSCSEFQSEK